MAKYRIVSWEEVESSRPDLREFAPSIPGLMGIVDVDAESKKFIMALNIIDEYLSEAGEEVAFLDPYGQIVAKQKPRH